MSKNDIELHDSYLKWIKKLVPPNSLTDEEIREIVAGIRDPDWDPSKDIANIDFDSEATLEDVEKEVVYRLYRKINRTGELVYHPKEPQEAHKSVEQIAARIRGVETSLNDMSKMLSDTEHACAKEVTDYFESILHHEPRIALFRQQFLQGSLLTFEAADQFIKSPAIRLMDAGEVAKLIQKGVSALDLKFVEWGWNETYTERQAHIGLGSTELIYVARQKTSPHEKLAFAPYLAEYTDMADYDETYPWMFFGSAAWRLEQLAVSLSESLPWDLGDMALYIVTGQLSPYQPVKAATMSTLTFRAKQGAVTEEWFLTHQIATGGPARGSIELIADPWVSADTIRSIYLQLQRELYGRPKKGRIAQHWLPSNNIISFVAKSHARSQKQKLTLDYLRSGYNKTTARKTSYASVGAFRDNYLRACSCLDLPADIPKLISVWKKMRKA